MGTHALAIGISGRELLSRDADEDEEAMVAEREAESSGRCPS